MRVVILIGIIALLLVACGGNKAERYDTFAKCLTAENATMYGAYWCPHCTQQKQLFGPSWQYATYVECSLPNKGGVTQACQDEGIGSYPTWIFADGSRQNGVVSFQQLSDITGCEI